MLGFCCPLLDAASYSGPWVLDRGGQAWPGCLQERSPMSWLLATTSHRKLLSCQSFRAVSLSEQFHSFPCRGGARSGCTPNQGDLGQTLLLPLQEQRWLHCRTACGGLCASRVVPAHQTQRLFSEKAPLGCRVHGASSDTALGKGGLRLCSQWGT